MFVIFLTIIMTSLIACSKPSSIDSVQKTSNATSSNAQSDSLVIDQENPNTKGSDEEENDQDRKNDRMNQDDEEDNKKDDEEDDKEDDAEENDQKQNPPSTPDPDTTGMQDEECKVDWENFSDGADLACFESPEDVLKNLPEKVRPNWVMMHTSRSNQFASMEYPRVMLMAPNGKFIVTVETVPDSKTVEVAVFDYNTNTWDLAGITYESGQENKVDRETCKACHTQKPRPNWTGYASWPGSVGDEDKITAQEIELLNRVKADKTSPIYQYMVFQNNYPLEGVLRPRLNYGENGNNQIMNFFLAKNAGYALTAAVMSNNNLSQTDRLALAYELACTENYGGIQNKMSEFGYNYQDFFGFHRTGDSPVRMWIGFNRIDFPAGILLLDALLKDDPQLATALPELANSLKDPRLEALFNKTLEGHPGWSRYDFGFQQEHYNNTQSASLSCAAIANMIN